MAQELNVQGLCDSCINKSNCFWLKNSVKQGRPVVYCEEFDEVKTEKAEEESSLPKAFVASPGFSMKELIPGWEA